MYKHEKGKLSLVQILISGACASGFVSMLGLQGVTRIIAAVGTFVVLASKLQFVGKGKKAVTGVSGSRVSTIDISID